MIAVVDASVAIKWFLVEPETPRALEIASRILTGGGIFIVPELFYFEVFAVVTRKHENAPLWASFGMRWLLNLPLRRISLTQQVSEEMLRFTTLGLTAYDSAYAALANLHQAKWLTFDSKASAALGNPEWVVHP
jgi:predicted nucleic acid-binding protein